MTAAGERVPVRPPARMAYVTSAFPTATETFVLFEILEVERLGGHVDVYPLRARGEEGVHPEADRLRERTHYMSLVARETLAAQVHWLRTDPRRYLRTMASAVVRNVRSPRYLLRALYVAPLAARMAREMHDAGVERVHAHWATHPALAAYVIRGLTGIPYSFTAHAHDIYVDRTMLGEKVRRADFVATISDFNRRLLEEELGAAAASKVAIVRCGVDLGAFTPRTPRPPDGTLRACCVAGLREKKGHRYLIDAVSELRDQGRDVRLSLVGEGELRDELTQQVARLGLEDRVELLGHRPRAEVSRVLHDSDVMVLPSVETEGGDMEGIPVALMEALASEVPVVASRLSGIPELVIDGTTGTLVEQRDVAGLVRALGDIQDHPDAAAERAREGRRRVLEAYDLQRNTAELCRLFAGGAIPAPGAP